MKIGTLNITGNTFLAPLAGITNLPFRLMVKECGCAVVCSEMISAKGLFYNSKKTLKLLASNSCERPFSVQIFGSDAISMARAAKEIQDMKVADIVDINFGCSVKKVIKTGAGVSLMNDPDNAEKILKAVRKAISLPLTIKIRSGWDRSGEQALNIAQIAQDSGVDAIALHPRTAGQGFKGCSNWSLIKKLKQLVTIPVIGNGDINNPQDALKMIELTGCDGIMVGRAAMSNPFILSQIEDLIKNNKYDIPDNNEIFKKMELLTNEYAKYFGEENGCKMLRSRLSWFVKGMRGCSIFRKQLSTIQTVEQALDLIQEFKETL